MNSVTHHVNFLFSSLYSICSYCLLSWIHGFLYTKLFQWMTIKLFCLNLKLALLSGFLASLNSIVTPDMGDHPCVESAYMFYTRQDFLCLKLVISSSSRTLDSWVEVEISRPTFMLDCFVWCPAALENLEHCDNKLKKMYFQRLRACYSFHWKFLIFPQNKIFSNQTLFFLSW